MKGKEAFAVWITGLPASGKSTIAQALQRLLNASGIDVAVLESDALRQAFGPQLDYSDSDREAFYRQMTYIGVLLVRHGVPVILDATANRRAYREPARRQIARFVEVYVDVPPETCMDRDPKGIYGRARAGEAQYVPGIQSPYEHPEHPDIVVQGKSESPESAAGRIMERLARFLREGSDDLHHVDGL